ncbi:SHOCT-like domain-containing protein [Acetonema longum]|uniref:YvlB/LiaX N-terminal domain-containing protein n=1 Tax=Acetonema longum DSM 6540 TaxID=1009370 RepID=F7NG95_9FIRM|nr:hypothetical protein [Acetonema longum]EGO65013.1 hypothetical protein ALO_05408 [Acetonema longum DSM 6540]
MQDEKRKVLEMIQNGKITANEGYELLKAMENTEVKPLETGSSNRFLRIRVVSGQHSKVNVNIPLKLLKIASKFADIGMKFIPDDAREEMQKKGIDLSGINFDELVQLIDQGLVDGKLVDVEIEDPHEGPTKVEIYVE